MLKVNEIFGPTIQGEGKSAGMKVMFLRLSTCNLHCVWCDTPYTWNWIGTKHSHPQKFEQSKELHPMGTFEIVSRLEISDTQALVVSGGEPLLQQQELVTLFKELKKLGFWIEVETNGTIEPCDEILNLVDQINCSPKLSNNVADSKNTRVRSKALQKLVSNPKTWFKFVISNEKDIEEVLEYVNTFKMTRVYLMPLGKTIEELQQTKNQTKELAIRYGFNYSDRLHVELWGNKRAV